MVNILSLSLGVSFFTLLFVIIRFELTFDRFHSHADRIYRLTEQIDKNGVGEHSASVPYPMAPLLQQNYPDFVENVVRLFNFQLPYHRIKVNNKIYNEAGFYLADPSFFDVFDFGLQQGDPHTVFYKPNTVVITPRIAKKYFGEENPIGKTIYYSRDVPLEVTGVFEKNRFHSHISFDLIAPFAVIDSIEPYYKKSLNQMVWNPCWTYVLLKEGVAPEDVESTFPDLIESRFPSEISDQLSLFLQPLEEIHLNSKLDFELGPNSDYRYIAIFSIIAALILLVATINFVNLSTSRSVLRAREIGIRKAIGAFYIELIVQFVIEALIISLIAVFLGLIQLELIVPVVEYITNGQVLSTDFDRQLIFVCAFSSGILVGLLSLLYPAYYLSNFIPAEVIKGAPSLGAVQRRFRSGLVVLQFVITISLIISTLVSLEQLWFLQKSDLGFNKEEVLVVPMPHHENRVRYEAFKEQLIQSELIEGVCAMEDVLGSKHQTHPFYRKGQEKSVIFLPSLLVCGGSFLQVFDIKLLAGRYFDKANGDSIRAVIINEEMVKYMGWESPQKALGQALYSYGGKEKVIGVVENFNFESLHNKVEPFLLDMPNSRRSRNYYLKYAAIKLNKTNAVAAKAEVKKVWRKINPNEPFESFFLHEQLNQLYEKEQRLGKTSMYFACIAMLIACIGMFGMASFMVDQRRKEIAIRKALGTTDMEVVLLLASDFFRYVLMALLIAWPLSYLMMNSWLNTFPYHIQIGWSAFVVSGAVIFIITLLTISYHTLKAALRQPVPSLQAN
ncbi:ABC transporter permease [Rapidithrix thailandica]|uniref:ABC transporter permease n=1 Tax=Rapidithrix thailandica TaxID=413964 RepID=A0AAW9S064_9BACT